MNVKIANTTTFFLLTVMFAAAAAQSLPAAVAPPADVAAQRFQCMGRFDRYANKETSEPAILDVTVDGMYVEISATGVRLSGAFGYDGDYSIVTRKSEGIGFVSNVNARWGGFFNRFSGKISLSTYNEDRTLLVQGLNATCRPAKPLF